MSVSTFLPRRKKKVELKDKTQNQINVIYPYRTKSGWSFDDLEVGLMGEPFVCNIPQIIDSIIGRRRRKFTAYISKSVIPEYTGCLRKINNMELELKGLQGVGWYKLDGTDMIGWLCPATLKYFRDYPDNLYFKIE